MLTVKPSLSALVALFLTLFALLGTPVDGAPQRQNGGNRGNGNGGNNNGKSLTAQERAAKTPGGISEATDGSTIVDMTVDINNLPIRFKLSAPANAFTSNTAVNGASQAPNAGGTLGINVLLHGDGGQSFFDFPNQGVRSNLAGVAVLAPDEKLFWGGGGGLNRVDGVAHALAVRDLVRDVIPQMLAFNSSDVFFTGVSGGSLLLSGFFVPAHGAEFARASGGGGGVLLNCAALAPQVDVVGAGAIAGTRMHFQSTQGELKSLQPAIPEAILAYEDIARQAGLGNAQINQALTVDNSPAGGHCAFDGEGFVSGVQLMADNFATIMQGGNGEVRGIGNVLNGVVGNEKLVFDA